MRILAVADVEDDTLVARLVGGGRPRYDAVVSCGDLSRSYLDFVATMANAPLLYVRGNHDANVEVGGTDLNGRIVRMCGLSFAGLEGSLRYREGIVGYTQAEMLRRVLLLEATSRLRGRVDVLVTHAPPRGFGDLDDLAHRGFDAFNGLLMRERPRLLLHGHVHLNYGMVERERCHPSGTRLVNAFGWREIEL